jgi:ribosomal protein L37AE/L43A
MTINPRAFLRRCFACNKDFRDHPGSSMRNGIWRCAKCTKKGTQ